MFSIRELDKCIRVRWIVISALFIPVIGVVDFYTGPDITFSLLYLVPVAIITWYGNRYFAIASSGFSAFIWLAADFTSERFTPSYAVYVWNFFSRLIFLFIVASLLLALREALRHEHELSRTDPLTKALNSRAFREIADLEISRSIRYEYPLTIAYFDIDDFKLINDSLGHSVGDKVLITLVKLIRSHIRKSDSVARIGGDEFIVLFPQTDQSSARAAINKIQQCLIDTRLIKDRPVSLSIGVVTYITMPSSVDKMIEAADNLMYEVKKSSKNDTKYLLYQG